MNKKEDQMKKKNRKIMNEKRTKVRMSKEK